MCVQSNDEAGGNASVCVSVFTLRDGDGGGVVVLLERIIIDVGGERERESRCPRVGILRTPPISPRNYLDLAFSPCR